MVRYRLWFHGSLIEEEDTPAGLRGVVLGSVLQLVPVHEVMVLLRQAPTASTASTHVPAVALAMFGPYIFRSGYKSPQNPDKKTSDIMNYDKKICDIMSYVQSEATKRPDLKLNMSEHQLCLDGKALDDVDMTAIDCGLVHKTVLSLVPVDKLNVAVDLLATPDGDVVERFGPFTLTRQQEIKDIRRQTDIAANNAGHGNMLALVRHELRLQGTSTSLVEDSTIDTCGIVDGSVLQLVPAKEVAITVVLLQSSALHTSFGPYIFQRNSLISDILLEVGMEPVAKEFMRSTILSGRGHSAFMRTRMLELNTREYQLWLGAQQLSRDDTVADWQLVDGSVLTLVLEDIEPPPPLPAMQVTVVLRKQAAEGEVGAPIGTAFGPYTIFTYQSVARIRREAQNDAAIRHSGSAEDIPFFPDWSVYAFIMGTVKAEGTATSCGLVDGAVLELVPPPLQPRPPNPPPRPRPDPGPKGFNMSRPRPAAQYPMTPPTFRSGGGFDFESQDIDRMPNSRTPEKGVGPGRKANSGSPDTWRAASFQRGGPYLPQGMAIPPGLESGTPPQLVGPLGRSMPMPPASPTELKELRDDALRIEVYERLQKNGVVQMRARPTPLV
jgi:hypothetical protein